jgi:hypothetical protein
MRGCERRPSLEKPLVELSQQIRRVPQYTGGKKGFGRRRGFLFCPVFKVVAGGEVVSAQQVV